MIYITLASLEHFASKFAEKITTLFVKKEDGKGLSSNDYTLEEKSKLAGVAENANNYSHPVSHVASMIAVDSAHRFVTDVEKAEWNGKAGTAVATSSINGLMSSADKGKLDGIAAGANNYSHPNSGVTAGTYHSLTVNTQGHVTTGSNPTTLAGYGITDAAAKTHTHGNGDITALDAAKITSGTIDIARLPAAALERCVVVADEKARLALTSASVQTGETVKVKATGKMYFVVDDTKLSTEAGYEVYTAGSAASVPWSGITGKPSAFTPSAHTHTVSQITDLAEATTVDIDNIISGAFTS